MKRSKFRLDNQHPFRIYHEPVRIAKGINGPFIKKEAAKARTIESSYQKQPKVIQPSVIKIFQAINNPITVNILALKICLANPNRTGLRITNVGTTIIYIGIDRQPSSSTYDHILPGCINSSGDGTGGVLVDDGIYIGEIWVSSSTNGGQIALVEEP